MQVDVTAVLNRRLSAVQVRVLLLGAVAIVFDGFDIQLIGFAAPAIVSDWHTPSAALGPLMAAALLGMTAGAAIGGRCGDKWGRKSTLIGSMLLFAIPTLLIAVCSSLPQMTALRVLSGIGFGAALPTATALVAEYVPTRLRAQSIALVVVGTPIGGMIGAALAAWLIPNFGWRVAFVVGGCLPLALALAMSVGLPESLRFLSQKRNAHAAITATLSRISGLQYPVTCSFVFPSEALAVNRDGQATQPGILSSGRRRVTLGLWLGFFASLASGFAFFSWIPTVLVASAIALGVAIRGSFYFNLFGVLGALCGSWVIARIGSRAGLVLMLAAGVIATLSLGVWLIYVGFTHSVVSATPVMVALSIAGASNVGAQAGLYALAASAYPTSLRATGIGWAASVGRIGAIVSTYGGGALLTVRAGPSLFFLSVSVLLIMTAVGVCVVDRHSTPQ
jgi:MFS transporter, AAHS family, 4-hydroxybenzoate transporter